MYYTLSFTLIILVGIIYKFKIEYQSTNIFFFSITPKTKNDFIENRFCAIVPAFL